MYYKVLHRTQRKCYECETKTDIVAIVEYADDPRPFFQSVHKRPLCRKCLIEEITGSLKDLLQRFPDEDEEARPPDDKYDK